MSDAAANPRTFTATLESVSSILASARTVQEVTECVAALSVATLGDDACASVLTQRGTRLRTLASTTPPAREFDLVQIRSEEGPSLDALATQTTVWTQDVARDVRWEKLCSRARRSDLVAVCAVFVGSLEEPTVLTIYASSSLSPELLAHAETFGSHARLAIESQRRHGTEASRVHAPRQSLDLRGVIAQARDVLMERTPISYAEALDVMRRLAGQKNVPVRDIAQFVVDHGEVPE